MDDALAELVRRRACDCSEDLFSILIQIVITPRAVTEGVRILMTQEPIRNKRVSGLINLIINYESHTILLHRNRIRVAVAPA